MIILGVLGLFSGLKVYAEKGKKSDRDLENAAEESKPLTTASELHHHDHEDIDEAMKLCTRYFPCLDLRDQFNQRVLSFLIGMLHGVAGPGGVLGVLPAVEMQNWKSSSLYLASFVFASTASMGAFAALYGELTKRIGATQYSLEFALRAFSSAMSVIVGVIWVVLSVLGRLDQIFH
jgi:hypothetical protein